MTTDAEALRRFSARWGDVIFKGLGGARTRAARLDSNDSDRLAHLSTCPTQFQAFVPGVNYRVHVVGEKAFAVRVFSDSVDYRYGGYEMQTARAP